MEEISDRIPVLEGRIPDLRLDEVLQVASLGRQYMGVELHGEGDDANPVGAIYLKAGLIVMANDKTGVGRDALFRLLTQGGPCSFRVFRFAPPPSSYPEPLGAVASLLMEASGAGTGAADADGPLRRAPLSAVQRPAGGTAVPPARPTSPPPVPAAPAELPRLAVATPKSCPVVAVVSPKGGVGKSTIALNLATALACREISVILLDATMMGDLDSALGCRPGSRPGLGDLLLGRTRLAEVFVPTAVPSLTLVPACSTEVADAAAGYSDERGWRRVIASIAQHAAVVIVDTPAGMTGVTQHVVGSASHVLGVLQAESMAQRTFALFSRALERGTASHKPSVLGVVVNMLQPDQAASLGVLARISGQLPRSWPFTTMLPRTAAILDASRAGVPLRLLDRQRPPPVAWLFDALAAEVADRLNLGPAREGTPVKLLPS